MLQVRVSNDFGVGHLLHSWLGTARCCCAQRRVRDPAPKPQRQLQHRADRTHTLAVPGQKNLKFMEKKRPSFLLASVAAVGQNAISGFVCLYLVATSRDRPPVGWFWAPVSALWFFGELQELSVPFGSEIMRKIAFFIGKKDVFGEIIAKGGESQRCRFFFLVTYGRNQMSGYFGSTWKTAVDVKISINFILGTSNPVASKSGAFLCFPGSFLCLNLTYLQHSGNLT